MDNQNNEMKVGIVELRIQVVGLQQTIENLVKRVNMLEGNLAMKADINHVREIAEQSVIIKKINDSKSVGMDCKVGVSLDGRVVAESIVEHTADSIKCGVIKGSEINETR
ncbi:hypothetical protein P4W10_16240 [Bacillus thuringiensis]|uniref:hypothetical protein n=1 Tax=Bacillus thuringiensis TaxID=1428 RepID=UPI002DBC06EC|nr:hypothetical protein [Bacillus thuringiensis]MEC3228217.1 hypothetical protein [Bacillus thuringiensis]MEC3484757.1 hypothetical protein [Bacillus thuringiensis]MED2071762.1 hypothetical protein [Bacillus thuringiensis]MED2191741.1 hypothetical protein [Bacillus thuringiensis]MED2213127.1 hypothetical protein [Bacillus thuringiensis]